MLDRRIHLVRHGVTQWNRSKRFQGHTDVPLNDDGREQASATAMRLADWSIVHCFASDLSRAFDTAAPIAEQIPAPLESEPDLREANKGEFEGKLRDPVTGLIGDETRSFDESDVHLRPPGGESMSDVRQRCVRLVQRLACRSEEIPAGDLLLVSHGGTMRALLTVLLDLPLEACRSFHFDNCSVTTVRLSGGAPPVLVRYNDCLHLNGRDDV